MIGNNYYTYDTIPNYTGEQETLGEKLLSPKDVPDEYIIDPASILKEKGWKYLKGLKMSPEKERMILPTNTKRDQWFSRTHWTNPREQ